MFKEIYFGLLIICLICIFYYRQKYREYFVPWFLLVAFTFIAEVLKSFVSHEIDNLIHHIYQPLELTMMILLYEKALQFEWLIKYRYYLIGVGLALSLGMSGFVEGWQNYNIFSFTLSALFVVAVTVYYFHYLMSSSSHELQLVVTTFFWINAGNLFYFSGMYFYEGLAMLYGGTEIVFFAIGLNYLLYVLYTIGALWKVRLK